MEPAGQADARSPHQSLPARDAKGPATPHPVCALLAPRRSWTATSTCGRRWAAGCGPSWCSSPRSCRSAPCLGGWLIDQWSVLEGPGCGGLCRAFWDSRLRRCQAPASPGRSRAAAACSMLRPLLRGPLTACPCVPPSPPPAADLHPGRLLLLLREVVRRRWEDWRGLLQRCSGGLMALQVARDRLCSLASFSPPLLPCRHRCDPPSGRHRVSRLMSGSPRGRAPPALAWRPARLGAAHFLPGAAWQPGRRPMAGPLYSLLIRFAAFPALPFVGCLS